MRCLISAALVLVAAGNIHAADGRKHPDDAPTAAQIAACTPDAQRLCLQHVGDRTAMRACMIAHIKQLSETCRAAFR
jgi:hypothetical protein